MSSKTANYSVWLTISKFNNMTNEEKAIQISGLNPMYLNHDKFKKYKVAFGGLDTKCNIYESCVKMAEWKDNEAQKHNDELIDKACEMYKNDLCKINHIIRLITSDPQNLIEIDESVEEFRKLLKIECYGEKR